VGQPYRPSRSLRRPARCLSNERPDDLARPLALVVRHPLQRRRVVYVKRHLNDKATVAGSPHDLHIGRAQFSELLIASTPVALATSTAYPTRCPTMSSMRKTSVYLDEDQAERLARLAREEGRPQAEILREAVATYQPKPTQDRNFVLAGSGYGDGSSIADVPEEDLLEGFGE
jgi:hypothetical protein